MTGFGTVADGNLVFRGSEAERANHHNGQGVGELALKHRALARDDAMVLARFAIKEWRGKIPQKKLFWSFEIASRAVKVLRHYAEVNVLRTKNVANLANHFVDASVRASVARAVVAGKKEAQLLAGLPARSAAEHPLQARQLDERADPHHQEKVGHAAKPPLRVRAALSIGQGFAGYRK